jgi:hypothetical protein
MEASFPTLWGIVLHPRPKIGRSQWRRRILVLIPILTNLFNTGQHNNTNYDIEELYEI